MDCDCDRSRRWLTAAARSRSRPASPAAAAAATTARATSSTDPRLRHRHGIENPLRQQRRTSIRTSSTPGASPSIRRASSGSPTTARRPRRSTTATASPQSLVVAIPAGHRAAAPVPRASSSTPRPGFQVTQGGLTGASAFIFVGEARHGLGLVAGREPEQRDHGRRRRGRQREVYKGLAHRHPGRRRLRCTRPTSTTASSTSSTRTSRRW